MAEPFNVYQINANIMPSYVKLLNYNTKTQNILKCFLIIAYYILVITMVFVLFHVCQRLGRTACFLCDI